MADMNIAIFAFSLGFLSLLSYILLFGIKIKGFEISAFGFKIELKGLKIPKVDSVSRKIVLIYGLFFIILGIFSIIDFPPEIEITYPTEGDKVPIYTTIYGNISGKLPDDQYMGLLVNPETSPGIWWPQGGPIIPWEGQWKGSIQLGGNAEAGTKFYIALILLKKEDDQNYLDYFCNGSGFSNGTFFPANAKMMDRITVTRI